MIKNKRILAELPSSAAKKCIRCSNFEGKVFGRKQIVLLKSENGQWSPFRLSAQMTGKTLVNCPMCGELGQMAMKWLKHVFPRFIKSSAKLGYKKFTSRSSRIQLIQIVEYLFSKPDWRFSSFLTDSQDSERLGFVQRLIKLNKIVHGIRRYLGEIV